MNNSEQAHIDRLRYSLRYAEDLCDIYETAIREISEGECACTGYYRCNGCERVLAYRAEKAIQEAMDLAAERLVAVVTPPNNLLASQDEPK